MRDRSLMFASVSRLVVWLTVFCLPVLGQRTISTFKASQPSLFLNEPTTILLIATLPSDPALIQTSLNAVRLSASGGSLVLGQLYDDGTHGDSIAGDNHY